MKINESVKCPYCGNEDNYIFYDGTPMLECHHCNKSMDIELKTKIQVIARKPIRKCFICGAEFESDSTFSSEGITCPHCGCQTYNSPK